MFFGLDSNARSWRWKNLGDTNYFISFYKTLSFLFVFERLLRLLFLIKYFILNIIRKQVAASRADAERDGVFVPTTMEEYCMKPKPPQQPQVHCSTLWTIEKNDAARIFHVTNIFICQNMWTSITWKFIFQWTGQPRDRRLLRWLLWHNRWRRRRRNIWGRRGWCSKRSKWWIIGERNFKEKIVGSKFWNSMYFHWFENRPASFLRVSSRLFFALAILELKLIFFVIVKN